MFIEVHKWLGLDGVDRGIYHAHFTIPGFKKSLFFSRPAKSPEKAIASLKKYFWKDLSLVLRYKMAYFIYPEMSNE